ncbi:Remorin family protein isoform 1 [Hibiscus syriacus]|uniref:Remorin family protein isoform 1 n=1 Tax=Hibiscus syriacus TaxID=106335 RepID=A0A6A2Y7A5_HIBSY|nr:triacylglycerol lipase OBL1-like [Hibiscus syriacus]KAE8669109.1 Remorin family protein isoform 1 [Hibiscus syriacus]
MAAFHNGFCEDAFVLNPEKASLFDLLSLLLSPQLENRRFIDCPGSGSQHRSFRKRWTIFVSVLVQKLLFWATKPMAFMGDAIEMWLNLLSSNRGPSHLLLNLATGKIEWPKRSSATFTSSIGNADIRTELDQSIKGGDAKYKAALSVMASKISYENEAFVESIVTQLWKMKFVKFYNFWNDYRERDSTQAFILQDTQANPNLFVVAFRGTSPFDADDWRTDADLSWCKLEAMGNSRTHNGFMQALGLQKNKSWPKEIEQDNNDGHQFAYYTLREKLREILKENEKAKFILTGHSLGGALAILFPSVLMLHEEKWLLDRLDGVYTFGQPRVGDEKFGEYMKENMRKFDVKYFRYVYCNDMVPRVPYDDKNTLFKHFGPCLFFNSFYVGKVLPEEPNKNYFSLLWVIPKVVNAVWELNRGFILPYLYGPNYKEGWSLRLLRLAGLIIPGLSAHSPQDYVNSTRLGTLPDNQLRVHQLTTDR